MSATTKLRELIAEDRTVPMFGVPTALHLQIMEDCGAELAVHWDLPAEVRTAIGAHHHPGSSMQHKRLAAMVHIADIAVRTMKIGFAGDDLIPEMDPYAKRLKKSVEEITSQRDDIVSQVNSILGGDEDTEE